MTRPGLVVAVDVGGTELKAGLVREDGSVLDVTVQPTLADEGAAAVLARVAGVLGDLAESARARGAAPALAAGVAVPGLLDEKHGVVRFAANLGWDDVALAPGLEAALGLEVVLRHDVRAAALAEARVGAAIGVTDFLFLALGTGLAAAVVLDGRLRTGRTARAGEIGHVVVEPGGVLCSCGQRGCLETVASARAILHRYESRSLRAATSPPDSGPPRAARVLGAAEVLALAARGDTVAVAVRDEATAALSDVIARAQALLEVEMVVLGGGLALAGETLLDAVRRGVAERLGDDRPLVVARSSLGQLAGLVGAGLAAWDEVRQGRAHSGTETVEVTSTCS